jgi:hypothetical protein
MFYRFDPCFLLNFIFQLENFICFNSVVVKGAKKMPKKKEMRKSSWMGTNNYDFFLVFIDLSFTCRTQSKWLYINI